MILGQKAAPSSVAVGAGDSAPTRKKRYMQKIPNTIEKIMSKSDNLPFPASIHVRGAHYPARCCFVRRTCRSGRWLLAPLKFSLPYQL